MLQVKILNVVPVPLAPPYTNHSVQHVLVCVGVGVLVGVFVTVAEGVFVGVAVLVLVFVGVLVGVGVDVGVGFLHNAYFVSHQL